MEKGALLVAKLRGWPLIRWTINRLGYKVKPNKIGRQFLRVLHPVDSWVDESNGSEESFIDVNGDLSVSCQENCSPLRILASYFGARAQALPPSTLCYRFWEGEALQMGGALKQTNPTPCPWPPEYSAAHHDLSGDQRPMARGFLRIHRSFEDRRHEESHFEVYREIARLVSIPTAPDCYTKNSLKKLRKLYHTDRDGIWLPIAKEFNILLQDKSIIEEFRKLFSKGPKSAERAEWNRMIESLQVDPIKFNLRA